MKKYGKEIQDKANEIIVSHQANGLSDDQAKQAAIVTVTFMIRKGLYPLEKSTYQKVYNHLTGTPCPYK